MKRLVSLFAIALVSSLFVVGCGKAKTCADGNDKGKAFCQNSDNFEDAKACFFTPKEGGKADEGTCAEFAQADKDECSKFDNKETECNAHVHSKDAAGVRCHYSKDKCLIGHKKEDKKKN